MSRPAPLPVATAKPMLELRILNGLHRGATLPLDGDAASLGSGANNDVVLLDPGIAAEHGRLVRNQQLAAFATSSATSSATSFATSAAATGPGDSASPAAPWQLHRADGAIIPVWPEQVVALGPLRIVLADEGAPWEPWFNALHQSLHELPHELPHQSPPAATVNVAGSAEEIPGGAKSARSRPALPLVAVWAGAGLSGIVAGLLTLNGLHDAGAAPVAVGPVPLTAMVAMAATATAMAQPSPSASASPPMLVYPTPPAAPAEFAAPPFILASVSATFAVTPDGRRLLPGDRYQGYKLVAIAAHSVLFTDAAGAVTALAW